MENVFVKLDIILMMINVNRVREILIFLIFWVVWLVLALILSIENVWLKVKNLLLLRMVTIFLTLSQAQAKIKEKSKSGSKSRPVSIPWRSHIQKIFSFFKVVFKDFLALDVQKNVTVKMVQIVI